MTRESPGPCEPFAAARAWSVEQPALRDFPCLDAAWKRSRRTLTSIHQHLLAADLPPDIVTVAVSGSLGRMEQLPHSDVDLIVIVRDELAVDRDAMCRAYQAVWSGLRPLGLPPPQNDGIFATPATRARLCRDSDRGRINEDLVTFGQRIQLLLDCQPVYGHAAFQSLVGGVLERYLGDLPRRGDCQWAYLLHDLGRYFHSLAVAAHWKQRESPGKWRIRNIKRLHSRRVLQAGLLWLLGESSKSDQDRFSWVLQRLTWTPLERLGMVHAENQSPNFARILVCYETFLERMQDDALRRRLELFPADGRQLGDQPDFAQLRSNAESLAEELVGFLLERRQVWSRAFYESLIF